MDTPQKTGKIASSRPHSGFTLIELLTVIAIIAILAAILIPVVGSVRKNARASQDLSNLRQLGFAVRSYALDNKSLCIYYILYTEQEIANKFGFGAEPGDLVKTYGGADRKIMTASTFTNAYNIDPELKTRSYTLNGGVFPNQSGPNPTGPKWNVTSKAFLSFIEDKPLLFTGSNTVKTYPTSPSNDTAAAWNNYSALNPLGGKSGTSLANATEWKTLTVFGDCSAKVFDYAARRQRIALASDPWWTPITVGEVRF